MIKSKVKKNKKNKRQKWSQSNETNEQRSFLASYVMFLGVFHINIYIYIIPQRDSGNLLKSVSLDNRLFFCSRQFQSPRKLYLTHSSMGRGS